ncbi:hypothetical protein O6H91_06G104500 [Diphasiastrum complanatum]|uniref:Uncharacterized protein n=1 Tax=Diphasiastrum complanatum TaxID=34168 RepID=A0ACC2DHZ6_DIPCM|nr:hypothetical protein O6H91_06G104500 [Diphasiastrum complanatum]
MQHLKLLYHYMTRCPGKAAVLGFLLGAFITSALLDERSIWTISQRWMNSLNSSTELKLTFPIATFSGSVNSQVADNHSSINKGLSMPGSDELSKDRRGFHITEATQSGILENGMVDDDNPLKNLLLDRWATSHHLKLVHINETTDFTRESVSSILLESVQPPHLRDCRALTKRNVRLDSRSKAGKRPRWLLWKGLMGIQLGKSMDLEDTGEEMLYAEKSLVDGPYPPWVKGGDEDNLPRTRRVQRDLWLHQHPVNCSDPKLRFLIADWEREPGYGIGAQIAAMIGILAIAMNENRILVTGYLNRADHEDCSGHKRSHWSCYFFPETSNECRARALGLASRNDSWQNGIITSKEQYNSKDIWLGKIPQHWGKPWEQMQPTTEVDGKLLLHHRAADRRWWRAQVTPARNLSAIEMYVWVDHEPWTPNPLISIHIRQGDKASEMKVVRLEKYMELVQRLRERFPNAKDIWLSTEMQDIIEGSGQIPGWNFYYTNITRQYGNTSMAMYEASLGRKASSNNAFVNFLMAEEADFFIGALGSTWCFLIDGMRSTGGKVMAGYMSVNKDRFW